MTQFALGAAIGQAVLVREAGTDERRWGLRAAAVGGLMGTLPDLDVVFRPFLDGPEALGFHRGVSHSAFFCTIFTPPIAWFLAKVFTSPGASFRRWCVFVWLALNTHWMLDSLTTYGTQVYLPFSNFPVNIGSVFIIDPIYTLCLLLGLFWTLWVSRNDRPYRSKGVNVGLTLSTLYLAFSLVSKCVVYQRLEASLESRGLQPRQLISTATPFNCLLWYGYADFGDRVEIANSSLLDDPTRPIEWFAISKNQNLLKNFGHGKADQRLIWFSRGFYRLEMVDGQPFFIDLRMGRMRGWFSSPPEFSDDFVFRFALTPPNAEGPYQDFEVRRPSDPSVFPWGTWWRRIRGLPLE